LAIYFYCLLGFAYFAWILFFIAFDAKPEPEKVAEEVNGTTNEAVLQKAIEYDVPIGVP
jgi:hypothetical protein